MFDILAKIGGKTILKDPYLKKNSFLADKNYQKTHFRHGEFELIGLSHKDDDSDHFESKEYFLAVQGKVFLRYNCGKVASSSINASDLLSMLTLDNNYIQKIKGNFVLILYIKKNGALMIIIDHFAMKPFYYCHKGEQIVLANNLNHFKEISTGIDEIAVLEQILFTYPLQKSVLLKNVYQLEGGEILSIKDGSIKVSSQFDLESFVFNGLSNKFNSEQFIDLFNYCVWQRANASRHSAASLTGGFDGRAVISALMSGHNKFFAYSFGRPGGENTEVPSNIALQTGIDYRPIYLDRKFEDNYTRFAFEAVYFSDGLSCFERANYMYAFSFLTQLTNIALTGLVGGELFGPVHQKTDYLNQAYYDLIYCNNSLPINRILQSQGVNNYIDKDFRQRNLPYIESKTKELHQDILRLKSKMNAFLYYFYDLLRLGFRRFYGSEIHMERFYAENLSPFFDIDILENLLNTDYKELYRNAFKENVFYRRNGRKLQATICAVNNLCLAQLPLDRGYSPFQLLDPVSKLSIPYHYFKRKLKLIKTPAEFISDQWSLLFYKKALEEMDDSSNIFNMGKLIGFIKNYTPEKYTQSINRLLSLHLWLKMQ